MFSQPTYFCRSFLLSSLPCPAFLFPVTPSEPCIKFQLSFLSLSKRPFYQFVNAFAVSLWARGAMWLIYTFWEKTASSVGHHGNDEFRGGRRLHHCVHRRHKSVFSVVVVVKSRDHKKIYERQEMMAVRIPFWCGTGAHARLVHAMVLKTVNNALASLTFPAGPTDWLLTNATRRKWWDATLKC